MANNQIIDLIIIGVAGGTVILASLSGITRAVKKWSRDWSDAWENGVITKEEFLRQIEDTFVLINIGKHIFKRILRK